MSTPKGQPTLEDALIYLANSSGEGMGFDKEDNVFGMRMAAKALKKERLSKQQYKDTYAMLKKYNNRLLEGQMDIRLIPKEPPEIPEEEIESAAIPGCNRSCS